LTTGEEVKAGAGESLPPLDDGFPVRIILAELLFVWLVHLLLLYMLDYTEQFSRTWWTFHILKVPPPTPATALAHLLLFHALMKNKTIMNDKKILY
jgi:hypothetical protein